MRCDRSWSVFVLCVIGRLIAWPSVLYAQEVTDLLNEAHEQYEQSLEKIERDAITRLDQLIDQYSDQGNLKKVLELRTQKTKLLEDRNWPESVLFRSMRAKIRSSRVRAKKELADAYEDAIATLTKERRYDDAVALQEELEELIEIQEEFDFRSEEPEQKKPENDGEDPKPKDTSPPKSPVKAKAARPAPPQKQAASKAGREGSDTAAKVNPKVAEPPVPSQELANLVSAGDEREVIANRLSTTQAKIDALDKLLRRVSEHYLVTDLTYADYQYLSWLIVVENRRLLNGVVWYPGTPKAVKSGLRWSASRWSGSIESSIPDVQYRFLILWLMGSTSPEQFIERVQVLNDSGELEPSISRLFSEDDLKVWLAAIGCNDREKLSEVLGKLHAAHVEFPAIKKFTENDGL